MTPPAPSLDRTLFKKVLTEHTSPDDWSRWFKDIQVSLTSSEILLSAPSRFVANQVTTRFLSQVESAAKTAGAGTSSQVRVTVSSDRPEPVARSRRPSPDLRKPPPAEDPKSRHPTNHHRFDTFHVGPSNLFAYAAATCVAENADNRYNPLYIYGSSGLGKTHLLLAIANRARRDRPDLPVRYCTSEQFVHEFIQCVTKRQMEAFRRQFRQVGMLIVDDFQFLQGKTQTLEEFFWTFDSLYSEGKQVILGCDRPPRDLDGVADRTRSRISAGLVTELVPPDFDTRLAILHRLEQGSQQSLEEEVLRIIADRFPDNIRDLVSAVRQLQAYSSLTNLPVTPESALQQLAPIADLPSLPVTPASIIKACADAYGTTIEEILHHNRRPLPSAARQVAMYLTREITGLPFARIGSAFDRGHSTVLAAHRRVQSRLSADNRFVHRVTAIYDAINNS